MPGKNVGILLFNEVEVLDFCGPFEVFSVTRLDEERRREDPSPFKIHLIAPTLEAVTATGGLQVLPHAQWSDDPKLDILVVPGGWGTRREMENEDMLALVRGYAERVDTLASVCTGALILANAGILRGRRATTHWRTLAMMQNRFPDVQVDAQSHVVQDGNIFTSAGISAGIDMALLVVAKYFGSTVARATARHMEYPYPESNARRVQP